MSGPTPSHGMPLLSGVFRGKYHPDNSESDCPDEALKAAHRRGGVSLPSIQYRAGSALAGSLFVIPAGTYIVFFYNDSGACRWVMFIWPVAYVELGGLNRVVVGQWQ